MPGRRAGCQPRRVQRRPARRRDLDQRAALARVLQAHPGRLPRVSRHRPFREETEALRWRQAPAELEAWQQGRTGIPIIDAAMRQLLATGWMHNRLRMVVAMFLSKNLLIDWREGERWFMRHLIDGDLAANNGGWQWSASTGTDAVPYFRLFNPLAVRTLRSTRRVHPPLAAGTGRPGAQGDPRSVQPGAVRRGRLSTADGRPEGQPRTGAGGFPQPAAARWSRVGRVSELSPPAKWLALSIGRRGVAEESQP